MTTRKLERILACLLSSSLIVFLFVPAVGQEMAIVFPAAFADIEGPLDTPAGPTFAPSRIQSVFRADEFLNQLPESHRYIVGFRWRPDKTLTMPGESTIDNIVLKLSTTGKAPGELDSELSENIGADEVVVYEGPITLSTMNSGPSEGPKEFDLEFNFERQFRYDPTLGNLLVDFSWFSPYASLSVDECCSVGEQYTQWISPGSGFPLGTHATIGGRETTITQFIFVPEPVAVPGDFNHNGLLDVEDIDLLTAETMSETPRPEFDLNDDAAVNNDDRVVWVEDLKNTWFGDSNLDGEFNSSDMVKVFVAGKYELDEYAGWGDGDWDGSAKFDSGDMVLAFSKGGYEQGQNEPAAVPEPSSALLLLISLGLLVRIRNFGE